MKVVCDTSVIITLHRGEIIDCLGQLFTGVLVPPAVEAECRRPSTRKALLDSGINVQPVERILPLSGVHQGEREAISLAVEQQIPVILLDDEKAFKRALEQGLTPIKSLRVVLLAKQKGIIPSAKTVLDRMITNGEGIQEEQYQKLLQTAGE